MSVDVVCASHRSHVWELQVRKMKCNWGPGHVVRCGALRLDPEGPGFVSIIPVMPCGPSVCNSAVQHSNSP